MHSPIIDSWLVFKIDIGDDEILPHETAEHVTGDMVDRDSMRQESIDQVRTEMRENIPTAQVHNDSDNRDEEEHQSTSTTADEEKPPSWNKKYHVISAFPFLVAAVCLGIVVWLVPKGDSSEQHRPPDDIESPNASCLCSCSPTVFAFTLNFSSFCPGNLVDDEGNSVNDAIGDKSCFTTVVGGDSRNSQPIHVETVTIQELNMKKDIPVKSATVHGPFEDGDTLTYESISLYANLTTVYFPFVLQMTLRGQNSDFANVINTVAVEYTARCNERPIYPSGSTIGWVDIVSDVMNRQCSFMFCF
jgi:hypothetical protein